jgi:hypothetical protein
MYKHVMANPAGTRSALPLATERTQEVKPTSRQPIRNHREPEGQRLESDTKTLKIDGFCDFQQHPLYM